MEMQTYEHVINGRRTGGSGTRRGPVVDPAHGTTIREVTLAEPSDVDAAVAAAATAFQTWRDVSVAARSRLMFEVRRVMVQREEELARRISEEHGKTLDDARGEVVRGREVVEFACGIPELMKGEYSDQVSTSVDSFSFRQPLGVVAGITPFNFPIMVPLWMHPVAIATGNTFVLKPSERVPGASDLMADIYREAGLPDGVFNVVHGDKVAVDALLDHADVAAVSFVGSTPIARYVHDRAAATGKRVQALGGAKNHAVVAPDADLDVAAEQIVAAGYGSAGQRCMAISAVVAVDSIADDLIERIARRTRTLVLGPGQDEASDLGPLITRVAVERAERLITEAAEAGGSLVVDGRGAEVPGRPEGFFVGPTLIDRVDPSMGAYTEEIFGPVLSVLRVPDLDAAIDVVNASPYGNGSAVFTSSGEVARRFQREISAGMVGVNVPVPVPMAFHSFGGWKDSRFAEHHVHGPEGVRFYTQAKVVTARWPHVESSASAMSFPTAT